MVKNLWQVGHCTRMKLNLDRKKGRKIEIRVETEKVGGQQTGHALP